MDKHHHPNTPTLDEPPTGIANWAVIVTVLSAMTAAWLAAESTGLLDDPLRRVLTGICLGIALLLNPRRGGGPYWAALLTGLAVVLLMLASPLTPVNVLAVSLFTSILAIGQTGSIRQVFLLVSRAICALGIYVLARSSIPIVWLAADRLGGVIGSLADITGRPLRVGATFGGIDLLVVMTVLYLGWLANTKAPKTGRALVMAFMIGLGHLLYLCVLSFADAPSWEYLNRQLLPAQEMPVGSEAQAYGWIGTAGQFVPWNVPMLAVFIHLAVAGRMIHQILKASGTTPENRPANKHLVWLASLIVAVLLPMSSTLSLRNPNLEGKKVVAYEKGFLNWLRPKHSEYGRLSIGMYGMLPTYVESLGGHCIISPDLSSQDLADADILILIYPNEPWETGQLKRIWEFVHRGGALLVMGEHTIREKDGSSRFNDVLEPTAMRVRFDSAMFEIGGWLKSYEVVAHPSTTGIAEDRNQFGIVIGASIELRGWRARPLLVGRWGWADTGDEKTDAMMGNQLYDRGEKLGDLVLAAEQRLGKGTIVSFGDTSSITNGIIIGSHMFMSRLLGYLSTGSDSPQAGWRQAISLLCALALIFLLFRHPHPVSAFVLTVVLAGSVVLCDQATHRAGRVLPNGHRKQPQPNNLAYIDKTHLEANSGESWRVDGLMGLELTLMRNGYLTLSLPEFTRDRVMSAALLVSIAPSRKFSRQHRQLIVDFVENGGIFICTVGYGDHRGSQQLLSNLGFEVGRVDTVADSMRVEPQPMGHFKVPYLNANDGFLYVRYHAAWPVAHSPEGATVISYGRADLGDHPVIVMRQVGRGKVVVIGDTAFAMNKNLEYESGEPFEGLRENADFWRWLITLLNDQPQWIGPSTGPVSDVDQTIDTIAGDDKSP